MRETNQKRNTQILVLTAFFAALTYVSTQIFQFRVPTPVGFAFVHLGNTALMLAGFLLGPLFGSISACIGFLMFDVLNGYAQDLWKIMPLSFLKCAVAALVFHALVKKWPERAALFVGCMAGFWLYLFGDVLANTVVLTLAGSTVQAAFLAALPGSIAPFINMGVSTVLVLILYAPIKQIMERLDLPIYTKERKA